MRTERKLSDETKERISTSLKSKHSTHTETHKRKISDSMKRYWSGIPYTSGGAMEELITGHRENK